MFKSLVRRVAAALLIAGFCVSPTFTAAPAAPSLAPDAPFEGPGDCPIPLRPPC